jgi:hypothetical protein
MTGARKNSRKLGKGIVATALIVTAILLLPGLLQPYEHAILRANSPIVVTGDEINYKKRDGGGEALAPEDVLDGEEVDKALSEMREQMEDEIYGSLGGEESFSERRYVEDDEIRNPGEGKRFEGREKSFQVVQDLN